MNSDYRKYARMPLKQRPNRVWRTYEGGALIDRWKGDSAESDGSFPEEWIMSTIAARGKNRPETEGLSMLKTPAGVVPLRDLIATDPTLYLGERLAKKYGTTGVLIKMLDAKERLTIQVHPDKEYARNVLDAEFGKTESWYVLGGREIAGQSSVVYMGFKEHVTRQQWEALFKQQNVDGMLDCLHKIEINPGDAFMVYGGVPHAIGAGCFLMEVQEPTDYTMRVEKVTPAGLTIDEQSIHQGVGEEKMLDCFHYEPCTREEALRRWKIDPDVIDATGASTLSTIFNEKHTDCFGLNELHLNGEYTLKNRGSFYVAVIYDGAGTIHCDDTEYDFGPGDEIFFSAAITEVKFRSKNPARILLCYPPFWGSVE